MTDMQIKLAILIGYGLFVFSYGSLIWEKLQENKPKVEKVIYDPVSHDDQVVKQKVETSFHNYTVVLRNGIVAPNGVIHHANCKCKINK